MAALHFLRPASERNGSPWRWAGLLPAAMGLTLVLHSARLFNACARPSCRSTGPRRWP
jgi:hypothetical protein